MRRLQSALLATCFLGPSALAAQEPGEPPETTPRAHGCEEAITVFQDVSRIGRKDRAAGNMTRRHAEMAEEGWRFADMEVYTENGDLEGFYLSYTRSAACPEPQAPE